MTNFDFSGIKTPAYIIDENILIKNLEVLQSVMEKADCKILLAQKAFSSYYFYPLIGKFLAGTASSGLFEARLGFEEMKKENHIYSPAYRAEEIDEISEICSHIIFNSFDEIKKFKNSTGKNSVGLRINPEYGEVSVDLYNPCGKNSRLGTKFEDFLKHEDEIKNLDGLHFHCLCEQNSDVLVRTFEAFEKNFGPFLKNMKWLNLGGGHHITRADYDLEILIDLIKNIKKKYDLEVYLEPGEAVVLNAGFLASKVLAVINDSILILDTSFACHMPDVLEMPYRPNIINAGNESEYKYNYILGGPTCLAGDAVGGYSFKEQVSEGDILVFEDMALYTIVKNNTFNGMNLPAIYARTRANEMKLIKEFGYEDFKSRL